MDRTRSVVRIGRGGRGVACALLAAAACCAVALGQQPGLKVNKDFTIEDCGTPIKVLRLIASTVYKHPDTGKLHLFIEYGNNNGYGIGEQEWEDGAHRFVDVDLESGDMRRCVGGRPGGVTTSHFFHPNGKMYLFEVKTKPASLAEYDTRTGKYDIIGGMGNSAYKTVLTPSGRFYTGEVGGDVDAYDPAVSKLSRWRMPAGRPIFWGVYTMEVDEPYIYCGMTNRGNWFLTVIDTRTGQSTNYFDPESGQKASGGGHGIIRRESGNIYFGAYLLKDGKPVADKDGKPVRPAQPDKTKPLAGNRPWPNMWRVSGYANKLYDETEQIGLEFDVADAEPNNWNGGVSTVRWRKKGETDWRTITIKGLDLIGSSPKCLGVAPDGTMVGVATMYGSVFRFDPKTGKSERIGDAPGSCYTVLALNGHTYFCGYVAFMADYDHSKPYAIYRGDDFSKDGNPKRHRTSGKWTTEMLEGPDGRIYLGGKYGRHTTGGGLSIFDPKTKKMEMIRKPFLFLAVSGLFIVNDGRTLAITTRPLGKGAPERGAIFLYDFAARKLGDPIEFQMKANPDQMFVAGDNRIIGVSRTTETDEYGRKSNFTLVYGLDLKDGKMLYEKRYPGRPFTGVCAYDHTPIVRGPDGCGWLFVDDWLGRIHPDGTLEKVRQMDYRGNMIFQGRTLYIYNGGRVYHRLFANVVRIPNLFK